MILVSCNIWLTRRWWCAVVGVGWGGRVVRGSGVVGASIVVVVDAVLIVLRDYVVFRQVDGIDGATKTSVRLHLPDIVLAVHSLTLPLTIQKHPLTRRCNLSKMNDILVKMSLKDGLVFTNNYTLPQPSTLSNTPNSSCIPRNHQSSSIQSHEDRTWLG